MSTVGILKTENNSKYTEDWVPIRNISNGMIQLNNGEYVTGIKIFPKNIFILDQESQNNALYNLRNFYNILEKKLEENENEGNGNNGNEFTAENYKDNMYCSDSSASFQDTAYILFYK